MKKSYLLALLSLVLTLTARSQEQPLQVYALKFAESSYPFTVADWTKGGPKDQRLHISFSVWLIKAKGHTVLVDAGFLRNAPDAAEFKLVNYTRPDSVLLKLGIRAGDITDIIMSHPHWDHIGGLALFPNAHIWIQKEDYNDFVGSMWQKGNSNGGFSKDDVKVIVAQNLAGKVSLVNGDQQNILPGITVFTGSRHTFNSQYVLVNTGSEKIILASDNIWTYYSLEHMVPPADGGTLDPAGYIKAMQRMKTLASNPGLIVPGHDAQVYSRFPVIAEGIVKVQ